jgi:hypothetical protein
MNFLGHQSQTFLRSFEGTPKARGKPAVQKSADSEFSLSYHIRAGILPYFFGINQAKPKKLSRPSVGTPVWGSHPMAQ